MRLIFLLFAAIFGLQGCVSNGTTPKSWDDAQIGSSSCDQLAGRYSNSGSEPRSESPTTGGSTREVKLTSILRFDSKEANEASEVRLSLDGNGVAKFIPMATAGASIQATSKLALICRGGVLSWSGSIRDLRGDNVGDALVGPDRISFEVRRGSDGALYVQTHEVAAGLAYMFFPIGGSETNHFRFVSME
jgi:hypothetical protein